MHKVCSGAARVSGHFAGGTHHAFYDRGEGYCVFSDIAVAANIAITSYAYVGKILIVDLDVHQGNGNAVLFQNNNRVHTFSMHCSGNYFSEKQTSDYDVEVPPGTGDEEYLRLLESSLPPVFDAVRPDLVFYQAGVDILARDKLGKLKVSREGVQTRNKVVYRLCREHGARLVVTMGGGYPQQHDPESEAFRHTVQAHADVYRNCLEAYGIFPVN
jgi:acetoin utilization deacetylase AcuC-like enzyme